MNNKFLNSLFLIRLVAIILMLIGILGALIGFLSIFSVGIKFYNVCALCSIVIIKIGFDLYK